MTCDRLVCANCAGPVREGRCAVCRAERQRLHADGLFAGIATLTPSALLALLLTVIAVMLLVHRAA